MLSSSARWLATANIRPIYLRNISRATATRDSRCALVRSSYIVITKVISVIAWSNSSSGYIVFVSWNANACNTYTLALNATARTACHSLLTRSLFNTGIVRMTCGITRIRVATSILLRCLSTQRHTSLSGANTRRSCKRTHIASWSSRCGEKTVVLHVCLWPTTGLVYDIIASNSTTRLGIARTTAKLMGIGTVFKLVTLFLEEVYNLTRIES